VTVGNSRRTASTGQAITWHPMQTQKHR
jgi:hypothetical protein